MATICPALLARDSSEFEAQLQKIAGFAKRIQIDLCDGQFTDSKSVSLNDISWPPSLQADIHLMYARPQDCLEEIIRLKPGLAIIHAEAEVDHKQFATKLQIAGVKVGLAVLPETSIDSVDYLLPYFDHLLVFAGDLGHFGGEAKLNMLSKVGEAKAVNADIEIGWDGGVNLRNARQIADGGVDVLNVGGFIQHAEDPQAAYQKLTEVLSKE
jgi:ribulose-phosphate 3-epimerase